ncbi:hypothetical protein PFISCL1PPCAC_17109, partial [Pristionchus fissidentatus]
QIYFELFLARRSTFWVTLIIIPSYLLGLMILLGLFFSSDEPSVDTSVNLGLISFTSMTFIIGILADSLPKSESLSNLGWYIFVELLITALAVLSVFFQAALNRWVRSGVKWYTGRQYPRCSTDIASSSPLRRRAGRSRWYSFWNYLVITQSPSQAPPTLPCSSSFTQQTSPGW